MLEECAFEPEALAADNVLSDSIRVETSRYPQALRQAVVRLTVRLREASPQQLERWAENILDARDLAAVFREPS